jgi:hypothetical protein
LERVRGRCGVRREGERGSNGGKAAARPGREEGGNEGSNGGNASMVAARSLRERMGRIAARGSGGHGWKGAEVMRLPWMEGGDAMEGLVRLLPEHMDWMGLEKNENRFDLFGFQTHPIPLNPHGLRANRTSPKGASWGRHGLRARPHGCHGCMIWEVKSCLRDLGSNFPGAGVAAAMDTFPGA